LWHRELSIESAREREREREGNREGGRVKIDEIYGRERKEEGEEALAANS